MRAQLKANILRGYVRWLAEAGLLDGLRPALPPALIEAIDAPPPPTAWLDCEHATLPLVEAVARRHDLATVRRMSREAASGPILTLLRPLVEGVIRLSMGPAGVVRRLPLVVGSTARGIEFEVDDVGPREARLVMKTSGLLETRPSAEAWAGAIEAILQLAGAEPRVEVLSIEGTRAASRVVTRIAW
jgi:hypothetical protein